jgi:hypothetical protein
MTIRQRRVATTLFVTMVHREGLPRNDGDTKALAADCYRAAELLLSQGKGLGKPLGRPKRRS